MSFLAGQFRRYIWFYPFNDVKIDQCVCVAGGAGGVWKSTGLAEKGESHGKTRGEVVAGPVGVGGGAWGLGRGW